MKIYLASPFFNETECSILGKAETILRNRGFDLFSPREHEARYAKEIGSPEWSREIFEIDRDAIDRCDCMVMLFHGVYSDSGTACECGYAYAKGKPVVVCHINDDSNIMVHEGSHTNIRIEELETYDFEAMPKIRYLGKMK